MPWEDVEGLAPHADTIQHIASMAKNVLKSPLLPHYTDHSLDHALRVVGMFVRLARAIPSGPTGLSTHEWLVGVCAAVLHDIGMHYSKHVTDAPVQKLDEHEMNEIRRRHGHVARDQILYSISSEAPPSEYKLPVVDLGLSSPQLIRELAPYIADVAGYHTGNVDFRAIDEKILFRGGVLRLRLLVHLLRLADALDADHQRIDLANLKQWTIDSTSMLHWWRHHYVTSIEVDELATVGIRMTFPEKVGPQYVEFLSSSLSEYIQREITAGEDAFRLARLQPKLKPITISNQHAEARERPPAPLLQHIDDLLKKDGPSTNAPIILDAGDPSPRAALRRKWGTVGNPWTQLHVSSGDSEFVSTSDLQTKFEAFDELMKSEKGGIRIVFGARGGGKSTFLASLHDRYKGSAFVSSHDVSDAGLSQMEHAKQFHSWLFQEILQGLSTKTIAVDDPRPADCLAAIDSFKALKPLILIDNLDRYTEKPDIVLIRRFFQIAQGGLQALERRALIVISATDEWQEVLSSKDLNYIGKAAFLTLAPFSENETRELIDARLRASGSSYDKVFSPDAYKAVHAISRGNPRETVQACSIAFDAALDQNKETITADFVKLVFGSELKSRGITAAVKLSNADPLCASAIANLYMFHLSLEKAPISEDLAWGFVESLLQGKSVPSGDVPSVIVRALARIARQTSDVSKEGVEARSWKPSEELRALSAGLMEAKVLPSDFLSFYRLSPFQGSGTASELKLPTRAQGLPAAVVARFETARDLIHDAEAAPPTAPIRTVIKAFFALEQLLVAYMEWQEIELPAFYIANHDEGRFSNGEGGEKRKSSSRMKSEMFAILDAFYKGKVHFFKTWPEMRLIAVKAGRYLREGGQPPDIHDQTQTKGSIRKIGDEFASIMRTGEERAR